MEGLIETKMDNQDLENNAEYWDWVSEDRRVATHIRKNSPEEIDIV